MPRFDKFSDGQFSRERLSVVLTRLVQLGWLSSFVLHDVHGSFDLAWTDKGRERARQFAEIVTELHGGPYDLTALAVICRLHPP